MKFLEVFLIASQLALVTCRPQDIRIPLSFSTPGKTERLLAISSHDYQPIGFQRITPDTFFINDHNQNQNWPKLVAFTEVAEDGSYTHGGGHVNSGKLNERIISWDGSTGQEAGIVFEGAFPPRPERLASADNENEVTNWQQGYVIIPSIENSRLESVDFNEKQEQHLPKPQIFIFRNSQVQSDSNGDKIQDIPLSASSGMQIHRQAVGSWQQTQSDRQLPSVEDSTRRTRPVPHRRPEAALVTRLTAPSSDPRSPNTLLITKKPCEICCIGNEVEPCKSCCAHTPLLNPKTLKTVVG